MTTMKDLKQKMTTSISEVLETMFYMPLEFSECGNINDCGIDKNSSVCVCRLDFAGNFSGHFIIFVPHDFLTSMAADFMGEEPEDITREYTEGTIKEIINMVGGNLFSAIDNKVEFRLGIPEIIKDDNFLNAISNEQPEGLVIAESIEGHLGFIIYAS